MIQYLLYFQTVFTILCIMPMFVREVPDFVRDVRAGLSRYSYSWYCGVHRKQPKAMSVNGETEETVHLID